MRSSGDFQDHTHTKPGPCNPRAEAGDLQPLVYIWSQNLSLHRNKTISDSYFDLSLFCERYSVLPWFWIRLPCDFQGIIHKKNLGHVIQRLKPRDCNTWLTHLPLDKVAAISQTTFSSAFSWMKRFGFLFKIHWNLFPSVQLIINQLCFRQWIGDVQATSHYLNQSWFILMMHMCVARPQRVNTWPPKL